MHHILFVFVSLLFGVAIAADWTYAAGISSWHISHDSSISTSSSTVQTAYNTCQETTESSTCVHPLTFIFSSFALAFGGGYILDTIASGTGQKALLDHFNVRSKTISQGLHATRIVDSHVHPHDGLAIRLNVHGDGTVMHLHTNGTHGMLLFDAETEQRRRETLDAAGYYFKFSGMNQFKTQVHSINQPYQWGNDIDDFVEHWTQSNLQEAETGRFEVCNQKKTATFFYGLLVAENQLGNEYEPMDPPGCH